MLALLKNEAAHRGVPSCVMTFEPHPRDYFAAALNKPDMAPARIVTLRDKLTELARCGVDQTIVLPFNQQLASQAPQAFIDDVLVGGLGVRYVLVGDDFRFGAKRAGDYAMPAASSICPLKPNCTQARRGNGLSVCKSNRPDKRVTVSILKP